MAASTILWFETIGIGDVATVSGKNASLGELVRGLSASGVRVPAGFATTAQAYRGFLAANALDSVIQAQIAAYHEGERRLPIAAGRSARHSSMAKFPPPWRMRSAPAMMSLRAG